MHPGEGRGPIDHQLALTDGASAELIRDLGDAVRREIDAESSAEVVGLSAGHVLATSATRAVWSFGLDASTAEAVRPDVPATLVHPDHGDVEAQVLAVGDESVVISAPTGFGGAEGWSLTADNPFVHRRLLERLDELLASGDCDEELLMELRDPDSFVLDDDDEGGGSSSPNEDQELAARRATEPGIRFTWGPPGTGKTRVLAMAAAQAAREGRRVLVLSHANVAVDVALERIADELGTDALVAEGRVVRSGSPQSASLLERTELLPHHIAGRDDPTLAERIAALSAELRALSSRARSSTGENHAEVAARLTTARKELRAAAQELDAAAREVVDGALIVGTTLARSITDQHLWSSEFDVVIIDEASMAPLPVVLALVLRGATTISFFGDFRQLPPIAVAADEAARAYFAQDVFEFGFVIEAHDAGQADPRLTTLTTQFRMGESICAVINELAYDGMLRTAPTARDAAIVGAERGIAPGEQLAVIDTSGLGAYCAIEAAPERFSRCNPRNAMLAASLAETLRADGFESVGVISPYRGQIELIGPLVHHLDGVIAATVHKFQGSECDAIVLDLTDAAPMTSASQLTGTDPELARRLLNVAVSRARQKLVVLADRSFCEHVLPFGSMASRLVSIIDDAAGASIDGAAVVTTLADQDRRAAASVSSSPVWLPSWSDAVAVFADELDDECCLEVNVAGASELVGWLKGVAPQLESPSRSIVRAAAATMPTISDLPFGLRLQERTQLPWVILNERLVAVGPADGSSAVAIVRSPSFASAFRRLISPEVL